MIPAAVFLLPIIAQAPLPLPPELPLIEEIEIPEALPDPWKMVLWVSIGLLAFIAITVGVVSLILVLTRKKKRVLTAESLALRALSETENRADELTPNEFSIEVSNALKNFVQNRFSDPVRFETAEEFFYRITETRGVVITPKVRDELAQFLHIAEEIKFGLPPDAEARKKPLLEKARSVIETQRQSLREAAGKN